VTGRTLIADSSHQARRTLRGPLASHGFAVSEAEDVRGALRRLRAEPHAVAFVDIGLPGGVVALIDEVMVDLDLALVSVVLLTDDPAHEAVHESLRRGAIDCLRKPLEPAEAVARASAAVRMSELQRFVREGNERLSVLAATDHLTGLLARRFLESHLRGLVSASARHGRVLSLVMIDLDNFKEINDTHGHAVGDVVLRSVVTRLRSRLREEDLLGRWGGDELALLLCETDLSGAATVAEGLRALVAETSISVDGEALKVTLSAGVAQWHGEEAHDLIGRADAALYEAKAGGGNRVHRDPAGAPRGALT
jgi:two-component system, cell cycle response regulator